MGGLGSRSPRIISGPSAMAGAAGRALRGCPLAKSLVADVSAPRIAGIGLQYFSEVRPAEHEELFVGDAGRGS